MEASTIGAWLAASLAAKPNRRQSISEVALVDDLYAGWIVIFLSSPRSENPNDVTAAIRQTIATSRIIHPCSLATLMVLQTRLLCKFFAGVSQDPKLQ